jgi:hypothetical protein
VPPAVEIAREWMHERRDAINDRLNEKLNHHLQRLERLQEEHERQLDLEFAESDRPDAIAEGKKRQKKRKMEKVFDDFFEWMENTMTIEDRAYIQVIAVLKGTR